MVDIFNLKPHVVSRDMSGKTILIYGGYKTGKTTNACKFPKPLLVGLEKGYNLIPGVLAAPVNNWREMIQVKDQLIKDMKRYKKGEIEEPTYKTIIIDTADLAWDMCGAYIAQQAGKEYCDDVGYGKGPKHAKLVFSDYFQELSKAGYALVIISHCTKSIVKDGNVDVVSAKPSLHDSALEVLAGMVDLIAYADVITNEDGTTQTILRMRGNSKYLAGSRSPYTSEFVPFTYDALADDMAKAVDRIEVDGSGSVTSAPNNPYEVAPQISFAELMEKVKTQAETLRQAGYAEKYRAIVDKHIGKDKKAKDCTEAQAELLGIVSDALETEIEELGLVPAA